MRIAIDGRNIGRSKTGSEVVIRELLRHLMKRGQTQTYYILTDTDDPSVHDAIRAVCGDDVTIVTLRARNKFLWAAVAVPRYVRSASIDVFHTEYIVPLFLPRSVRVVTHIHDVSFAAVPQYIRWVDRWLLRMLIPRSLRRADAIIAVSEFTRDEIIRYYGVSPERITVIRNAAPPQFSRRATTEEIETVRSRYHLPSQYIFSLGTMQPRKNIPFLVAAFARVADKMPDVDLVLSGRRAYNFDRAIEKTIAQFPHIMHRIHFTGFIADDDLPAVYAAAKTFVFPSLYEGFGIPIVEALSQGTRVLCNDIPPFREVGGDAVTYADATNLAAFAQSLYTVTMCEAPSDTGLVQYSWDDAAQRFYEVLVSS